MGPGWLRWTVTWCESANGSDLGASDGVLPGNLQMNPGLAKWTVFLVGKFSNGAGLGEMDGILRGKSDRL